MGARPLTTLGLQMLAGLPPRLRGSSDYQAVIHAYSREVAQLEASIESVRSQLNPATADVLLDAWEHMLKLPVGGPPGASITDRRNLVLTRLRKLVTTGTGQEWEQAITALVGPGWSYLEHDPGNPSSPAAGIVQVTLPYALTDPAFANAQNQIQDITDAHIQLEFASSVLFQLDTSPMDSTSFGA